MGNLFHLPFSEQFTQEVIQLAEGKKCLAFGERCIRVTSVSISLNFSKIFMPQLQNGDTKMNIMVLRGSDAGKRPKVGTK